MSLLCQSQVAGSSLSLGLCYRAPHSDEIVVEFDGPFVPIIKSGGWVSERQNVLLKGDGKKYLVTTSFFASFDWVSSILNLDVFFNRGVVSHF